MLVEQRIETGGASGGRQGEIGPGVAAPILARGGDELGERVGFVLLHLDLQIQGEAILAFVQRDIGRLHAVGQADRRRFGHRQSLFGAAVERQGQFLDIAVRRKHVGIAVIPERGAVGCRRRHRDQLHIVRGDSFLHFVAGELGERQPRLMRRPKIERKRQLHGAVEVRREGNLRCGQMGGGLADKGDDFYLRGPLVVDVAIAGGERRVPHVQDLAVVREQGRVQRHLIHPEVARSGVARRVVDLAPARNRGGTSDVVFGVVHERNHVREIAFGAARRGHGREIAVGEIARKIAAEILGTRRERKGRIGGS